MATSTAYDVFNKELFSGSLPACLITIQRHKGAYGYFSGERFANTTDPEDVTDEIALNSQHFTSRKADGVLSTLAHEMVHLWQHHFGEPPRKGYHDREWAPKMRDIGLIPTDTGEAGGKTTGQKMSHIIEDSGRFYLALEKLIREHPAVIYHDRASEDDPVRKKKAASKTKYTCPECGLNLF